MLRKLLVLLAFVALVLIAIQFVPYGRDHTNPPVLSEPQWDGTQTRALFMTACGDCHSNETTWPLWTRVAPSSWLAWNDVVVGRAKLNISEWGQRDYEAGDSAQTVRDGEMPPRSYLWLHPEAKLSDTDREALTRGLIATFGTSTEGSGEKGEGSEEGEGR